MAMFSVETQKTLGIDLTGETKELRKYPEKLGPGGLCTLTEKGRETRCICSLRLEEGGRLMYTAEQGRPSLLLSIGGL